MDSADSADLRTGEDHSCRLGGDHERFVQYHSDRRRCEPRPGPRDRHCTRRSRRLRGRRRPLRVGSCRAHREFRPDCVGGRRRGDPSVAGTLIDRYEPEAVILVAGATPLMRPLQHQTWETFSVNWHTDVRIAFHWLREALLKPLRPGSMVIVVSSGAALAGSPLSGGYAGAKATQRFITGYAREEARRAGLDITFTAVLPRFAPQTGVGRPAVEAYAARAGQSL